MNNFFWAITLMCIPLWSMESTQPYCMVELDNQGFIEYKRDISLVVYAGNKVTNPDSNKALQFYTELYSRFENPAVFTYNQLYSLDERTYINQKFTEHFLNSDCKEAYLLATATNTETAWDSFLKKAYHAGKLLGEQLGVCYSGKPGPHNYTEFLELNQNITEPALSYLKCGSIIFYLKQMKRTHVIPKQ